MEHEPTKKRIGLFHRVTLMVALSVSLVLSPGESFEAEVNHVNGMGTF